MSRHLQSGAALLAFVANLAWGCPGFAEEGNAFHYPELLATPSASERLNDGAKQEGQGTWKSHWPVQASAATTLVAGLMAMGEKKDDGSGDVSDAHYAGLSAVIIGAGWVGGTLALSAMYSPYRDALATVKKMPAKTMQEKLAKERLAEEGLREPASLAVKLKYVAVASNFLAAAGIAATTKDKMTTAVASTAAVFAMLPLLFPYKWEKTWDYHEEYKRKIYGPIADVAFLYNDTTKQIHPGLVAGIMF